jgi:hypothetical protein
MTPEGLGLLSGAVNGSGAFSSNVPLQMQSANNASVYWRGTNISGGSGFNATILFGMTYQNGLGSPYWVYSLLDGNPTGSVYAGTGAGGTLYQTAGTGWTAGPVNSFGATFSSTTISCYSKGTLQNSTTLSGTVAFTATSEVDLMGNGSSSGSYLQATTLVAFMWTRTLTAAEMQQIDKNPYQFLIFPDDDILAEIVGSAFTQYLKTAAITLAETLTTKETRNRVKTNAFTLGETVATTIIRNRLKTSAVTLGQTFKRATAAVSATKKITSAQTFARAATAVTSAKSTIIAQSVKVTKLYSGATSAVPLLLGQTLSAGTKVFHGITVSVSLLQNVHIVKTANRLVAAALAQTVAVVKQARRTISMGIGQTVSSTKRAARIVAAVLSQTVNVATKAAHSVAVAALLGQSIAVGKSVRKTVTLLLTQAITTTQAVHTAGVSVATTLGQVLVAAKMAGKTVRLTLGQTFTVQVSRLRSQTAVTVTGQAVVVTHSLGKYAKALLGQVVVAFVKAPTTPLLIKISQGQTFSVLGCQFNKMVRIVQSIVTAITTFRTPGPQSTAVQVNFTIEPPPAPPVPPTPPPQPGGVFVSFD